MEQNMKAHPIPRYQHGGTRFYVMYTASDNAMRSIAELEPVDVISESINDSIPGILIVDNLASLDVFNNEFAGELRILSTIAIPRYDVVARY